MQAKRRGELCGNELSACHKPVSNTRFKYLNPGDVKPANGSGYRLLEANLRKCVSEQAAQSGIPDPRVTIRYRGPLTQEIVGPNLRLAISDFELKITKKPLSEPQSFALTIGSTRVTVIVGDTEELGGGMTGTSVLSDALAPTLKGHMHAGSRFLVITLLQHHQIKPLRHRLIIWG
jgi:hypothetical protein